MNPTTETDEVGTYMAGVRAALTGLPEATRDELLEDLPEHLAEVRAEGTGTLVERLGTPEAYAAELRATAGIVGSFPDPPPSGWSFDLFQANLRETRDNILRLLGRADVKVGPVIGYAKASEFLALLRPAWWVLRGYLAAMVLAFMLNDDSSNMGLLPRIGGSDLVALILLAGAVIGSILLGKRSSALVKWQKYALWSGTAVLILFAWGGFLTADSNNRHPGYADVGSYDTNPYSNVSDVFVYDSQNNLVLNARLYDQDGSPIEMGIAEAECGEPDPDTGEWPTRHTIGYPRCPRNAPFAVPEEPAASGAVPSSPGKFDPSAIPYQSEPAPSASAVPSAPAGPSAPAAPATSTGSSARPSVGVSLAR
ncbi:HAAS signaling domain-containing protein [Micromonosporaceae bacterium Da 78-11]